VTSTQGRTDNRLEQATVPQFLSDVELAMLDIECSLLDTLTPAQFESVQELVQATRILTAARCVLADQERNEQTYATTTTCAGRPRHRARRRDRLVSLQAIAPSQARRS
jgi:hypothetical protein